MVKGKEDQLPVFRQLAAALALPRFLEDPLRMLHPDVGDLLEDGEGHGV
jgi:hypothetical protein